MDLNAIENFLLVPEPGNQGAMLYELSHSSEFKTNAFVIIPYSNPLVKIPQPGYYAITKKTGVPDLSVPTTNNGKKPVVFVPSTTKQKYIENVKKLKNEIQLGNIYEINYCTEFAAEETEIDPLAIFLKLNAISKAPYAAMLKTGSAFILCASPELFVQKTTNSIFTKPIKGTSRRGKTKEEDEALKEDLHKSIKERTENVMAVDVARNDLSRFAKKGSVKVNRLYNIETFETVHQMVSTVSCDIKDEIYNKGPAEVFETIIEAAFPMASMTGAPKTRAMQLIDASEDFERNYYSGAMGIIDENGDFKLSVIIRTIFYNATSRRLSFAVGGAITYLSDPEKEYEECLLKASALLKALDAVISQPVG